MPRVTVVKLWVVVRRQQACSTQSEHGNSQRLSVPGYRRGRDIVCPLPVILPVITALWGQGKQRH